MTGAARIIFPDRHVHRLFSKMHSIPDFDDDLYALALPGQQIQSAQNQR
jgi:hypothetical protein